MEETQNLRALIYVDDELLDYQPHHGCLRRNSPMQQTDTLHATLKALMTAIESGDGDGLRAHLVELDRQGDAFGDDTPPMLRHYIEKRSYAKAIDFLEGRDEASATPNC